MVLLHPVRFRQRLLVPAAGAGLHGVSNGGGRVTGIGNDVVKTRGSLVKIRGSLPGVVMDGDETWSEFVDVNKVERRFNAVTLMGTGAGLRPVPFS